MRVLMTRLIVTWPLAAMWLLIAELLLGSEGEFPPDLDLLALLVLAALPPGITHASAVAQIKDRRASIVLASAAAAATAFITALVLSGIGEFVTEGAIPRRSRGIMGWFYLGVAVFVYMVFVAPPLKTVPLIDSVRKLRALRRRVSHDERTSSVCSECGAVCRMGVVGVNSPRKVVRRLAAYAVFLAFAAQCLLAFNVLGNTPSWQTAWSQPSPGRAISTSVSFEELRGSCMEAKLASVSGDWADWGGSPPLDAHAFVNVKLDLLDYKNGYRQSGRDYGWYAPFVRVRETQRYSDPVREIGAQPHFDIRPGTNKLRVTWYDARLPGFSYHMVTSTGGSRTIDIYSEGIVSMIGISLCAYPLAIFGSWLLRHFGPSRWKRLERAANQQCPDCGYPLSINAPASPAPI